jgi:hypothetical protein
VFKNTFFDVTIEISAAAVRVIFFRRCKSIVAVDFPKGHIGEPMFLTR